MPSPSAERLSRAATWLVALVVVASGILTLPRYGLTTDEALGNLFFGERYFHYLTSFDRAYLDFGKHDLAIHRRAPDLFVSPWRELPWVFPPFADTLSAATMELLGHRLGWLDPVDAFHLATILLVGLLLVCLHAFAAPRVGALAALVGIAILGSHPRFWGDMHNNVKDVPQAVLFSLTLLAVERWQRAPSPGRATAAGAVGGAALAEKVNAVFVPFVVILGLLPWERSSRPWRPVVRQLARGSWHWALMLVVAVGVFVAVWPWLWLPRRTLVRFRAHVEAFARQGGREDATGWNLDPLLQAVVTMPEVVLALVLLGTGFVVADLARGRDASGTGRFLLAWMAVPIARASLPGMVNFDGIRHFLEFLPAAALLAGVGFARTVTSAPEALRRGLAAALAVALASNVGVALVRYHPFQPIYFNSLVGGLRGASNVHGFPEATDYWGSSYRQGMAWLNRNAAFGARVYVPVFPWIADVASPLWLRRDLRVVGPAEAGEARARGEPLYVMYVTRPRYFDAYASECFRAKRPVHQVVVDEVSVMEICRPGS